MIDGYETCPFTTQRLHPQGACAKVRGDKRRLFCVECVPLQVAMELAFIDRRGDQRDRTRD